MTGCEGAKMKKRDNYSKREAAIKKGKKVDASFN